MDDIRTQAGPALDTDTPATTRSGGKPGLLAAMALLAIFGAATFYSFRIYAPCDDTYIYLVYVKNFLDGYGLTFNGMKVWGFTSVLWTMILVAFGKLPLELRLHTRRRSVTARPPAAVATAPRLKSAARIRTEPPQTAAAMPVGRAAVCGVATLI